MSPVFFASPLTTTATEVVKFYFRHRGSTAALPADDLAEYFCDGFCIDPLVTSNRKIERSNQMIRAAFVLY